MNLLSSRVPLPFIIASIADYWQFLGLFQNKWKRVAEPNFGDERRIVEIAYGFEGAAGEESQQETIILIGVIVAQP